MHGDALLDDLGVVGLHVDVEHVLAVLFDLDRLGNLNNVTKYQDVVREVGVGHLFGLSLTRSLHSDLDLLVQVDIAFHAIYSGFIVLAHVVGLIADAALDLGATDEAAVELFSSRHVVIVQLLIQPALISLEVIINIVEGDPQIGLVVLGSVAADGVMAHLPLAYL